MIVNLKKCHFIPCNNPVAVYIKVTWPHRFIDKQRIVGACVKHQYHGVFGASAPDLEEISEAEARIYEIMES